MKEEYKLTGGARIGNANATYPFADLYVDNNILKINASIVGNLIFKPQDIISIETYTIIPILGQGIKINHRIEHYNQKVIFWTVKDPNSVLNEIKKTGFLDNIDSKISFQDLEIIERQKKGGFPIKKSVAIIAIIIWNLLFLYDFIPFFTNPYQKGIPFGNGVRIALGLLFSSALLTLFSEEFRKLILKEGRNFEDIKKFVYLVLVISGFMFLTFSIINFVK